MLHRSTLNILPNRAVGGTIQKATSSRKTPSLSVPWQRQNSECIVLSNPYPSLTGCISSDLYHFHINSLPVHFKGVNNVRQTSRPVHLLGLTQEQRYNV